MYTHDRRLGPMLSLAAITVAGAGLWLVNVSAEPGRGAAVVSVSATPAPAAATFPPLVQLPSTATYSGQIYTSGAPIVVEVHVAGGTARAYVCDGYAIETWLSGTVTGDTVHLMSADGSGRLAARLQGQTLAGTLSLGVGEWSLRAPEVTDAQ